jgi:hypothetical protein
LSGDIAKWLTDYDRFASLDASGRETCVHDASRIRVATPDELDELLQAFLDRVPPQDKTQDWFLGAILRPIVARQRGVSEGLAPLELPATTLHKVADLYRHLGKTSQMRQHLLSLLIEAGTPTSLSEFVELMVADPPLDGTAVAVIFGPLFQRRRGNPAVLFPRLLDAIGQPSVAAAVLDLANFLTRQQLVDRHPAAERVGDLAALLGGIVGRLGKLESASPPEESPRLREISAQVDEGVSLAVSLCDALALIGEPSVIGKLYQAMDLSHRRLCTEAAAALAKLGEKSGVEMLVQLAAEPVARLRVLAYAEELGILDQVDPHYQTDAAQAEAELALWLAQPSQIGVPPNRCELIESREQYWPGYDEPVECYLFRFVYEIGDAEFSNIAIAGPLTHAFAADLSDLSPDDIYAAFAGWQAVHEDIYEADVDSLTEMQRTDVVRLERRLRDEGYDAIEPRTLGSFFGDRVLVATAMRAGVPGIAVVDNVGSAWWPRGANRRPLGPDHAYCIYKGRRLLRSFNP